MQGRGTKLGIRKRVVLAVLFLSFSFIALSVAALAQIQGPIGQPTSPFDRAPEDEITSLRTDCSKSYANPDGSITAIISAGPIHYKDDRGAWQDIDTTLSAPTKEGYGYSVTKSPVKVHFAATADGWQCVEFDGHSIQFAAQGASPKSVGIIDGSTITYPEAWPGVDLKYTVLAVGVKEELVLKQKSEFDEFRFSIRTDSLQLAGKDDGSIELLDESGGRRGAIPVGFAEDSALDRREGIELFTRAASDGRDVLCLPLDHEWLADASYPVVVDPTLNCYPSSDGYVYLSGGSYVWIDYYNWVYIPSNGLGCVKFNISGMPESAVPSTAMVTLARYPNTTYGYTVEMREITSAWSGLPSTGSVLMSKPWGSSSTSFGPTGLRSLILKWLAWPDTNFGLAWKNQSAVTQGFYSVRSATDPVMSVTYTTDTTAPIVPTFPEQPLYVQPDASIDFTWSSEDNETAVRQVVYAAGTDSSVLNGFTPIDLPPDDVGTRTESGSCTAPSSGTCRVYAKAKSGCSTWSSVGESALITVDATDPTVCIASPAGTTWHKAFAATWIDIGVRASDIGSGVDTVEVNIDTSEYQDATYDSALDLWVYRWQPQSFPSSATIYAIATDNAGNSDETSQQVAIETLAQGADIIYVRPDGDDGNDGSSWSLAKATLEGEYGALSVASSGDEVWVAEGSYTATGPIQMVSGVSLYGGFVPGATVREQRDWLRHPAVVDLASSYVRVAGLNDPARLDGFTLNNGWSGIWVSGSDASITIAHNTTRDCLYYGVYLDYISAESADIRIIDNWIVDNSVAGVYFEWTGEFPGIVVANNTIVGNGPSELTDWTGGIVASASTCTIANNILAYNSFGMFSDGVYNPVFTNNCLYGNQEDWGPYWEPISGFITDDPKLYDRLHLCPNSPCRDAGSTPYVSAGDTDIDDEPRTTDDEVDIGADQSDGCGFYSISMSIDLSYPPRPPMSR